MSRHGWNGGLRNGTLGAFLTQAGSAALVAAALAGCSAIPDDAKPASVYGESKPAAAQPGEDKFPDLANVPTNAPAATSRQQQEDIAKSLAADRAAAQQTDNALRTGSTVPQTAAPAAAEPVPASAPEPAPAAKATPAPVKAPVPAAAPVATPAPVKVPARATKPTAVKTPAPAAAMPAKTPPAQTPPAPTTPPALPEPETMAPTAQPAAPAKALVLEPGVIPVPARGGHRTLEEARGLPPAKDAPASAAEPAEEKPDPNAEQPVNAAPTTPVEVKPTVGGGK